MPPTKPSNDVVKLICGHAVPREKAKVSENSEFGYCPTCKRELVTGWPDHMNQNVDLARRIRGQLVAYLDRCEAKGQEPKLSAIVAACESTFSNSAFGKGHRLGGAIDAD